ncbi:hypothetical protein [Frankia sp. ACN1ag]|uniref:hypothetical protein n=1 Tax=Frankia sp. ACN1ag TaxID=102891 RepID=UPI00128FC78E|nr:hypothetical protein [Frankia sp. ACN1ag]
MASRPGRGGRAEHLAHQFGLTLTSPSTATPVTLSGQQQRAFRARTRRVDLLAARYATAELHRTAWWVHAGG